MSTGKAALELYDNPTPEMVADLANNMREIDAAECYLAGRHSPAAAAVAGSRGDYTVAALVSGRVLCMFGASRQCMLGDTVTIWELGTHLVERHPRLFVERSRDGLARVWQAMGEHVARGQNAAWAGNKASLRWLYWLGATFGRELPLGPFGAPFVPFTLEREIRHV